MSQMMKAPQSPEPRRTPKPARTQADGPTLELGPGHPLGTTQRSAAEAAYRAPLGDVTVHTGPQADAFVRSRNALAATMGSQVAFARSRYRPGTLTGDAILAHELAHVVQQGGVSAPDEEMLAAGPELEEHSADRAAAALLVSTHSGGHRHDAAVRALLGPGHLTPARTGGRPRVQTCLRADPARMSDVTVDLELTPEVQSLMDELEGLEAPYEAIRERGEVARRGAITAAAGRVPGGAGLGFGGISQTNKAFRKAREAAAAEGTTVEDVEAKAAGFAKAFQDHAVNVAYTILESNEKLVQGEADRYAGATDQGGMAELVAAAAPYKEKLEQARKDREYAQGTKVGGQEGRAPVFYIPPPNAKEKVAGAAAAEKEVRQALLPRFPVLADPRFPIPQLINTPAALQWSLRRVTGDVLENIQTSRGALKEDPSRVWQFDQAVAAARVSMNVVPGSVFDMIIDETIAQREREELFQNILLGALAIGLGLLSFGGGTVAVLAAVGGAALSAGSAYVHVQKYLVESAAAGSAFDRAKALSSQEPSLFWLAVDIVAAGLDLGMAARAFKTLGSTAKAVQTGAKTAAELKAEAVAFAKAEPTLAAQAEDIGEALETGAKKQLSRQDVISAAEKADPVAAAAVKAVGGSDAATSGVLRIQGATRGKLLSAFAKKPFVLVRLGTLIDEFPDIAKLVQLLGENLPPTQFEAVIAKYMLTRSKTAPYLLRAMAEVGITADDVKLIATSIGKTTSVREMGRKFAQAAIERVAERLPAGGAGIKKYRAIAAGLHPNQSGIIFERWATKNVYGVSSAERFAADKAALVKQYAADSPKFKGTKEALSSDHTLHNAGQATLVDYKSSLTAHKFGQDQLDQLDNYAELLRLKVKTPNGDTLTKVEYLFGSKAAAEKNGATVLNKLGDKATVYYIDDSGAKVLFTGAPPL